MDWKHFGVTEKCAELDAEVMAACGSAFARIDDISEHNQLKVLNAFTACRVGARHLFGSTGYGYGDEGRDMLDKVFAAAVGAEDALCRTQFMSGTHAITTALFGMLRKGMRMLSVTGTPYDTIQTALGIKDSGFGSLVEYGVDYRQIQLAGDGGPDVEAVGNAAKSADMVYIQRSRGYGARRALTLKEIETVSRAAKSAKKDIFVVVDNCYGEFTNKTEPLGHGADIIIGSLIKNPGGGIAETGGYIAGRKDLVELCAHRMTAPGVGREIGCNPLGYRSAYLGLYMAPRVTASALKSAVYVSALFKKIGFDTDPDSDAPRDDIVTAVKMGTAKNVGLLCKAIQSCSPIDSFVSPEASGMPGYENDVIMASGSFTNGSSIELSADAPMREPYNVFIQGGLNLVSSRFAFLKAAELLTAGCE